MCTNYVLVVLLSTVVLLDARGYICGGEHSEDFQDLVKRLHNKIREPRLLPPLSYSCELEKLAVAAVVGCQPMPPQISETVYIIYRNYLYDQGPTNVSHTDIVVQMILGLQDKSEERYKMERSDIESVGCGAAKCPESSGIVDTSVACFYGKVSHSSERDSRATTTIRTPDEEEEEEEEKKSASQFSTEPQEFATSMDELTTEEDFQTLTHTPSIDEVLAVGSTNNGHSSVRSNSDSSERDSPATTTTVTTPNEEEEEGKSATEPSTEPQGFATSTGRPTIEDFAASTNTPRIDEPLPARSPKKELSVRSKSKKTDVVVGNVAAPDRNGHFSSFVVALVMLELLNGAFHF